MDHKIPLQVFLSYRSRWTAQLGDLRQAVGNYNDNQSSDYRIELKVSESELHEGDSITDFMETMSTAGFVILMLGREYFQSPYCLHELLEICRHEDVEKRLFALPIKTDQSLEGITEESILRSWAGQDTSQLAEESGYCKARLRELQAAIAANRLQGLSSDEQDEQIKEKLRAAYKKVAPLINNVTSACETAQGVIELLVEKADAIFAEEKKQLEELLINNIASLIDELSDDDRLPLVDLLNKPRDSSGDTLAAALVETNSQSAMEVMQKWVKERDAVIPWEENRAWKEFFPKVESICGWLLINSVSHPWWIHNKMSLRASQKEKGHVTLGIAAPAYAEVVISRDLRQAAQFCLNSEHDAIPKRFDALWDGFPEKDERGDSHSLSFENEFVIDAKEKARRESLLLPLIFDLKAKPEVMGSNPEKLLRNLIKEVKGMADERKFYIVTSRYLQRLRKEEINGQSILQQINQAVGDRLVFVSYGSDQPERQTENSMKVCEEDEEILLVKLATILRDHKKRTKARQ